MSGGAGRDLELATELVTRMLTKLGLGGGRRLMWSERASEADLTQAEATLSQAYERVLGRLKDNEVSLATLARALVDRQELTGDEVRAILSRTA